ncbi:MAG TPA: hypothetical protein VJ718_01415 [Candidatus Binataceae bacterium]|nr:hypothetical protein [Candidatus Binataceae bacterium]
MEAASGISWSSRCGCGLKLETGTEAARSLMTSPPEAAANVSRTDNRAPGAGAIAAAFAIALIILAQGISSPFQKDAEPQSAQWIVDIVRNGDWLLPHDYYGFVDRKPPLFYWLSAIVAKVSGDRVDETRARSVSLIAGAALAAEAMAWSAGEFGPGCGWLAFAFLLGMYGFASRATTALTDMLMTFLIFSAYIALRPQLESPAIPPRTALAAILLGLAILTKGPVALVLVGLAIFIYMLLVRANPFALVARAWPWFVTLIAAAIAAAWYAPAFIAGHSSNLSSIFIDENFGHFMPASLGGTGEAARPIYYIVVRLIGGAMPLALLIPALIVALASHTGAARWRRAIMFQLALMLAVILFFSAASAKRDDYILPALPPLAILLAGLFAPAMDEAERRRVRLLRSAATAAIAIAVPVAAVGLLLFIRGGGTVAGLNMRLQSSDASYAKIFVHGLTAMAAPFAAFIVAAIVGSIITLVALMRNKTLWSGAGLAIICIAATTLWTGVLRPAEAQTRSLSSFATMVRGRVAGAPLYVAYDDMEFAWYYGHGVPALPREIARSGLQPGETAYLVARPRELARLTPEVRRELVGLIEAHVMGGGGPPSLYRIGYPPHSGLNADIRHTK